jgi:hypothetical protein
MSQCEHILDSGRRCKTPPVKGHPFCYCHGRLHANFVLPGNPRYNPPMLDGRHSVHLAIRHVYVALAKNLIDRKHAGTLLYCLQLAQTSVHKGLEPAYDSATEITPAMQHALHLDENLEDTTVKEADENTPLSNDTAARSAPIRMGVNDAEPIRLDEDLQRTIERSNRLATKKFSRTEIPEFVPELEIHEWQRITRDLPPRGEAGSVQQQLNCRRVLQILSYDSTRRRMYGAPPREAKSV